ncbi:MAG: glucose-6-phosphate isomerase family protein [Nanoarchaeota archaeon]|nr:glucose-6-phosphate isomerase family protein [Nanoarchaeota archaeon]
MKIECKNLSLDFEEKTNKLICDGEEVESSVRRLNEMKNVLFNKNFINRGNQNDILYYMFRGTGYGKNSPVFDAHTIRYDITVIMPYDLGGEFNKTEGHYHPIAEGKLSFAEIYEILSGEATYLLQKDNGDGSFDVKVVSAKAGDRVIMPPNYGHISINTGEEPLIEANLVNSTFQADYKSIAKMGGGALYFMRNRNVLLNRNYEKLSISYEEATKIDFLDYNYPTLYDEFIAHPEHFEFLNHPSLLK